jgi:hypothetical protein
MFLFCPYNPLYANQAKCQAQGELQTHTSCFSEYWHMVLWKVIHSSVAFLPQWVSGGYEDGDRCPRRSSRVVVAIWGELVGEAIQPMIQHDKCAQRLGLLPVHCVNKNGSPTLPTHISFAKIKWEQSQPFSRLGTESNKPTHLCKIHLKSNNGNHSLQLSVERN